MRLLCRVLSVATPWELRNECSNPEGKDSTFYKRSKLTPNFSLHQLDAYLIEGEPYNRFTSKIKTTKVARQKSNISEMWETGFKNPPKRTASALAPVRCPRHTDFFRSISTYSIVIDADLYCKYVNLQMCTKCTHKSYIKKKVFL